MLARACWVHPFASALAPPRGATARLPRVSCFLSAVLGAPLRARRSRLAVCALHAYPLSPRHRGGAAHGALRFDSCSGLRHTSRRHCVPACPCQRNSSAPSVDRPPWSRGLPASEATTLRVPVPPVPCPGFLSCRTAAVLACSTWYPRSMCSAPAALITAGDGMAQPATSCAWRPACAPSPLTLWTAWWHRRPGRCGAGMRQAGPRAAGRWPCTAVPRRIRTCSEFTSRLPPPPLRDSGRSPCRRRGP